MKVRFRDFKNNTRFDIKNADLKNQQIKRSRMIQYSHEQQRINYSNLLMQSSNRHDHEQTSETEI